MALLELADLGGGQDRNVLAGHLSAAHAPALPGRSRDADLAEQVGDLLDEGDVLGAAEHDEVVGQPEQRARLQLSEDRRKLGLAMALLGVLKLIRK